MKAKAVLERFFLAAYLVFVLFGIFFSFIPNRGQASKQLPEKQVIGNYTIEFFLPDVIEVRGPKTDDTTEEVIYPEEVIKEIEKKYKITELIPSSQHPGKDWIIVVDPK